MLTDAGPDIGRDVAQCAARVYTVRMARVNVSVPDDLHKQAKDAGLSFSGILRVALKRRLREIDRRAELQKRHQAAISSKGGARRVV